MPVDYKDVVRHPLVQKIVEAYDEYEKKQKPQKETKEMKRKREWK